MDEMDLAFMATVWNNIYIFAEEKSKFDKQYGQYKQ